ncbi:hypothetical protein [Gordonia tangerina]|uniref:Uncharacterized protein n=1 Tax=Gordonia tangerina TaxID=2911060 RepID=A0ABS9DPG7_9ACTN|nr:hypothetical protein [Gordonia tangerina]MCF3941105.1 hypothetical protein [Gordonia tangerina]
MVIRTLPPDRALCGTIVVDGPDRVRRVEFLPDGTPHDSATVAVPEGSRGAPT